MNQTTSAVAQQGSGTEFQDLSRAVNQRVATLLTNGVKIFRTMADPELLWDGYLASLPEEERQHHNCSCCRHFIKRYGGLVTIDDNGNTESLLWCLPENDKAVPEKYNPVLTYLNNVVAYSKVTGVLESDYGVLGFPVTGVWSHFSLTLPKAYLNTDKLKTAGQKTAERVEDFKNIRLALSQLTEHYLTQALTLLGTETLYRSEKVIGPVQFLQKLKKLESNPVRSKVQRHNLLWKEIASAPAGFLHPRASMAWTLLEDLMAGLPYDSVASRFKAKMNPDVYQRPQAAPTEGNVKRGEEIVAKLGVAKSLERRFARLDELKTIWEPKKAETPAATGGVFGGVKTKGAKAEPKSMNVPTTNITFDKLRRLHLPNAEKVEVYVFSGNQPFMAFVTAEHADAPPILQWDEAEARNPVSVYTYTSGSPAVQWGLGHGRFHEVTGIALRPHMWGGEEKYPHQSKGAIFVLEGCVDRKEHQGNALFPETLISDLREIRATIEAYSRNADLGGREQASACGIGISAGQGSKVHVRLTINNQTVEYMVDHWD